MMYSQTIIVKSFTLIFFCMFRKPTDLFLQTIINPGLPKKLISKPEKVGPKYCLKIF